MMVWLLYVGLLCVHLVPSVGGSENLRKADKCFLMMPFVAAQIQLRTRNQSMLFWNVVEEDQHSNTLELREISSLSCETVHKIIHEELRMKKVCARWIPHLLTDEQKQQRLECAIQLFDPNGTKRLIMLSQGMRHGYPSLVSAANNSTGCGLKTKGT